MLLKKKISEIAAEKFMTLSLHHENISEATAIIKNKSKFWSIKLGLNGFTNTKKAFKKLYMFYFETFGIILNSYSVKKSRSLKMINISATD